MQHQYSEVTVFLVAANIIVIITAIFFFLIIRIQQKRKQLFQKQLLEKEFKTREEALLQVSRDLHDEIGSSLSGINMLTQLALQNQDTSKETTAELLQKINTYTNEVIEKVSDMAWLLKPNQESLVILVKKLEAYSITAAVSRNIQLYFDVGPEVTAKELSIGQRKAVYLISKEAINNAIKYAACKNIYYKLGVQNNILRLLIKDDGKGFAVDEEQAGNGLGNMQARAKEIKAILHVHSASGKGTSIELEL
ncbi:MAG: hypothetical protein JNJ86_10220 [Chitinophagaceae bacterium]|nr:hypothetical protein [Chitinophagaceae bacterium]